jgi:hypothetical protein
MKIVNLWLMPAPSTLLADHPQAFGAPRRFGSKAAFGNHSDVRKADAIRFSSRLRAASIGKHGFHVNCRRGSGRSRYSPRAGGMMSWSRRQLRLANPGQSRNCRSLDRHSRTSVKRLLAQPIAIASGARPGLALMNAFSTSRRVTLSGSWRSAYSGGFLLPRGPCAPSRNRHAASDLSRCRDDSTR